MNPRLCCPRCSVVLMLALVVAMLAAGCGAEPSPTPLPPTSTPIPPTNTPIPPTGTPVLPTSTPVPPTSTPVPPTGTPLPTPGTAPAAAATPAAEIPPEDLLTLLALADSLYNSGDYLMAAAIYTEMLGYMPDPKLYSLRADAYDRLGDFDAAASDYLQAVDLGLQDPGVLNNLCWDLGITGQAEKARPYCEQAVEARPSANSRDSRGVTYAQLGMLEEAAADFQAMVDDLKGSADPSEQAMAAERQGWIALLEEGESPITPDVLAKLRGDTSAVAAPSTPVPSAMAVPRSTLERSALAEGFTFGEIGTSGGEETLTGTLETDSCRVVLTLVGPEEDLTAASLQIGGCSDDDKFGLAYWFMAGLLPGERERGKAVVYLVMGYNHVMQGDIETTGEQEIGNAVFQATRSVDSAPVLKISARLE